MDIKFSVLPTIRAHYATLVDDSTGRPHIPDYVLSIGGPVLVGGVVAAIMRARQLSTSDMASYIAGVAIFTALLFALVIYVFQLRMQIDTDDRVPRDGRLMRLVDQLFSNVNYAVVVGVLTTVIAMVAAMLAHDGEVGPYWTGVISALGLHLVLVVFMCIKRVDSAYRQIRRLPRNTLV